MTDPVLKRISDFSGRPELFDIQMFASIVWPFVSLCTFSNVVGSPLIVSPGDY